MAILENSLLKLVAAKTSVAVLPLGLIGVAAIWVARARSQGTSASPRDASSAQPEAADAARPGERTSYDPSTVSPFRRRGDREALLSQILEENLRLREALK